MGRIFETLEDGEWTDVMGLDGNRFKCCDCSLVHVMDFNITSEGIQFRLTRDKRSTGQFRRHKHKEFVRQVNSVG
ncbi:hypothetical protein LCGC14_2385820 [marine sediment metagenome]|uniref:Uncharacterized protein n=1 Tax=marine sediment metagenome TaxID=412755 RepID=A0A0F9EBZ6_9ZZZZ